MMNLLNASGVAALLEIARNLAANESHKRTIIFVAYACEEPKGQAGSLAGSAFFLNKLESFGYQPYCNINMDMVGRGDRHSIEFSQLPGCKSLDSISRIYSKTLHLDRVKKFYEPLMLSGDHRNYFLNKIPYIVLYDDVVYDIHSFADALYKIDFFKIARISHFVIEMAEDLASTNDLLSVDTGKWLKDYNRYHFYDYQYWQFIIPDHKSLLSYQKFLFNGLE